MRCKNCKWFKRTVANEYKEKINNTRFYAHDLDVDWEERSPNNAVFVGLKTYDSGICGNKLIDVEPYDTDGESHPLSTISGSLCRVDTDHSPGFIVVNENFGCIHFEHKDGKNLLGTMNSGD